MFRGIFNESWNKKRNYKNETGYINTKMLNLDLKIDFIEYLKRFYLIKRNAMN